LGAVQKCSDDERFVKAFRLLPARKMFILIAHPCGNALQVNSPAGSLFNNLLSFNSGGKAP